MQNFVLPEIRFNEKEEESNIRNHQYNKLQSLTHSQKHQKVADRLVSNDNQYYMKKIEDANTLMKNLVMEQERQKPLDYICLVFNIDLNDFVQIVKTLDILII